MASSVESKKTTGGSSLLVPVRTLAGSIDSAMFVGIMRSLSAVSTTIYGDGAIMHCMNVLALYMTACPVVLLPLSIFTVRNTQK